MKSPWRDYGFAVLSVIVCTLMSVLIYPYFELTNLVMLYLLGTVIVAIRGYRGPAAISAVLNVMCFDYFFVPPRFTFNVSDVQYVWTFVVMFTAAMIISHLTVRLREEAQAARDGEQRTTWLMEKAKKAEVEAETERLRSSLLSSVSHDFRTPLTAIVGSASTLLGKEDVVGDPENRELLENIQTEGEQLSHLVQNLLEATRLESGAVQLHKELYPLEEVIGSAIDRLGKALKNRSLNVSIPEDLPPIPMDGTLMEQVFINLLENGIRHTPPECPLEVSARIEGDSAVVLVEDRGSGLKEGDAERVFDKFYHAPSSNGAGLGLAICRAIINAHGGRITAANRKEGGAAFTFTLPLSSSPAVPGGGTKENI